MDNDLKINFSLTAKEDEMVETFTRWLRDSQTYHDEILKKQKVAYEYYIGNQTDRDLVPTYLSDTVENRIFEAVETMMPIATANAHQFMVMPGSEDPNSIGRAKRTQKVLERKYETLEIQKKLEDVTRHLMVFRYGVVKWGWSYYDDDVDVKVIDPRLIMVPKLRIDPHELPYVIEIQGYSLEELEDEFGKEKASLASKGYKVPTGKNEEERQKPYQVFECWTDDVVGWFSGSTLLSRRQNPYYDYEGQEKKVFSSYLKRRRKIQRFYNHLDASEKPFVFFGTFNLSEGPLPSTSLVEIGMPMQDSINVQKRSIINNLKQMGSGQVYVDSEAMTQEEADNITNEPGIVLRGKGLASENRIRREPGTSLPNAHFANLQHSESMFDNIMGVHSATRGAAAAKTLGQDILSRQQDYTRIDTITRVLNRGVARLANGLVQVMKMYYSVAHVVKTIGEEGAAEFIRFNQDDIEDQIEIIVKSGNVLPMDEVTLRSEAVQLWQLGALDPVTLFERLKFPDAQKAAQRLLAWKQGQLAQETGANIAEIQAGSAAKAQAKGETTTGRKVETPVNVLQRARQQLGGTAPISAGNVAK